MSEELARFASRDEMIKALEQKKNRYGVRSEVELSEI